MSNIIVYNIGDEKGQKSEKKNIKKNVISSPRKFY